MAISEELEYLYALTRFGVKPGLAVMKQMMECLRHPETTFKSIHVTGTNGKGSTCAMMESILREAGYRTALYTSPHVYAFNERIQINRVSIADDDLSTLVKEIREVCEHNNITPTFFEFTTALAFLYFSRSPIDIAVIEVGMGGLYDATNVIIPLVSVITNVGLDHTEYFGPTKLHVAREKAGIIKQGVPVITAEQDLTILKLFTEKAQEMSSHLLKVSDLVHADVVSADFKEQTVAVHSGESTLLIHLPLLGSHQVENMKTALATIHILSEAHSFPCIDDATVSGIANTQWEGRLQVVSQDPRIIIDGAHNPDGAQALAAFLQGIDGLDVLVFAAKKGKDISNMLTHVIPLFSRVIVTEGSFMPESAQGIAEKIRAMGKDVVIEVSPGKAFDLGRSYLAKHATMVVTGSLYMVADVLAHSRRSEV